MKIFPRKRQSSAQISIEHSIVELEAQNVRFEAQKVQFEAQKSNSKLKTSKSNYQTNSQHPNSHQAENTDKPHSTTDNYETDRHFDFVRSPDIETDPFSIRKICPEHIRPASLKKRKPKTKKPVNVGTDNWTTERIRTRPRRSGGAKFEFFPLRSAFSIRDDDDDDDGMSQCV